MLCLKQNNIRIKLLSYFVTKTKLTTFSMKKNLFTLLMLSAGLFTAQSLVAQDTWSLQRCIGYALDQNLTIKQSQATVKTAQLSQSQAKAMRLPGINANTNLGEQFGRTIDPTTNSFVNSGITFNSLSLNANLPIYSGGQVNHSIKQAKYDTQAAESDLSQATNTLALQVSQAYLTILLTGEQVANARNQVALSQKQLTNVEKLIAAGNLPAADKYNAVAQIARDEQTVITTENNLELAYLNLKQLMQMEPDAPLTIEKPSVLTPSSDYDALSLGQVFSTARTTQPSVQSSELRVKSAEEGIFIARAGYLPTVSLFGNLSSNYSSQFKTYTATGEETISNQTIYLMGNPVTIGFPQPVVKTTNTPYFSQLEQTFGQGIGVNVSIPIYQNGRTRLSVERAKLAVLNAQLQRNQVEQQLKNDIQTALANVRAAKKQMDASQKTFDASQLAYTNMEKRHAIGAVTTLELNTSKNSLDVASNNVTVARYDYLFRIKILEFYLGKPLIIE